MEGTFRIQTVVRACVAVMLAIVVALSLTCLIGCTGGAGGGSSTNNATASNATKNGTDTSAKNSTDTGAKNSTNSTNASSDSKSSSSSVKVVESGSYTSKEEVALYIHTYGKLPGNFISKTKATNAGWDSSKGNLQDVCPGKSIGGSQFYNDDGLLPEASGRTWKECDINYHGGYRGAERIVFSNDGLIYYTDDHYETFERLY